MIRTGRETNNPAEQFVETGADLLSSTEWHAPSKFSHVV